MGHIITRSLATRSLVERLRKEVFSLDLKSSGSYAQRGGEEKVGAAEGDSHCSGWLKGQLLQ